MALADDDSFDPNDYATVPQDDDELDVSGDRGDSVEAVEEPAEEPATPEVETPPEPPAEPVPEPEAEAKPAEAEADTAAAEKADLEQRQREGQTIPKARFDQVNERMKIAEAELAKQREREAASEKAAEFDFATAEKDYMAAVLDGDTDKALELRQQIRSAEQTAFEQRQQAAQRETREQTKAELELDTVIAEVESEYGQFNDSSPDYDEALTNEVLDLYKGMTQQGKTPGEAMRKASAYVAAANGLTGASAKKGAESETPAPAPKPDPKPDQAELQKKLDAAAQQPPAPGSRSGSEPELDVMNMDEDAFEQLDPKKLKEMRGDAA